MADDDRPVHIKDIHRLRIDQDSIKQSVRVIRMCVHSLEAQMHELHDEIEQLKTLLRQFGDEKNG